MKLSIAIIGITGRMGKITADLCLKEPNLLLAGGIASQSSAHLHKDIGAFLGLCPSKTFIEKDSSNLAVITDVFIDFSSQKSFSDTLEMALQAKKPLVSGVTGLDQKDFENMEKASKKIPILYAPNFSIGIAICKNLVKNISSFFTDAENIDIVEEHHTEKKDAPSGTALLLAKQIGPQKNVSIHSIRAGKTIGEHTIYFTSDEEKITIKHTASSRNAFGKGALKAAQFLFKQKPGLYSFDDLFKDPK